MLLGVVLPGLLEDDLAFLAVHLLPDEMTLNTEICPVEAKTPGTALGGRLVETEGGGVARVALVAHHVLLHLRVFLFD
jgi:hypothetical protein